MGRPVIRSRCELRTPPLDSLQRRGALGPHLPAVLRPRARFTGSPHSDPLPPVPRSLPHSLHTHCLLLAQTLSEADQRPLRQQSMGPECTLPYLLGKGNRPCTITRDWRCLGPCTVHQLPFYSSSSPPGHQSVSSLLVFGNLKVNCRRKAGSRPRGGQSLGRKGPSEQ